MKRLLPVIYTLGVLLFIYQAYEEFAAPKRTVYRLTAGVMAIIGAVFCAVMAFACFKSRSTNI